MKHRIRLSCIMLAAISLAMAQTVLFAQPVPGAPASVWQYQGPAEKAFTLPRLVGETSGLIYHDGAFWTFNDSGGKPEIYKVDPQKGTILQTIVVQGADNKDWEDITQDDDFIYIGDFGNNRGNRKDLRVYRVPKASIGTQAVESVPAGIVAFRYADQKVFSVRDRDHDFDCESVISHGDELLLFTKNWVNGRTRLYRLPKEPGTYEVAPAAELDAGGLVTGADRCKKTGLLALIGYTNRVPFVILLPGFDGRTFNAAGAVRTDLPGMAGSQTEGICFVDETQVAVSTEQTKHYEQAVYLFPVKIFEQPSKDDRK